MKTLLTLFVLFFSSSVVADDISDFQIEGMSIGDSLLDYFSEEEINSGIANYPYKDNTFTEVEIYQHLSFKIYENMQFAIKTNDKNYIIYKLVGFNFFRSNSFQCFKKVDTVSEELSLIFKDAEKQIFEENHEIDPTGESKTKSVNYWFDSGDLINVECYDWSVAITKKNNWIDNFAVNIMTEEYIDWLNNLAY